MFEMAKKSAKPKPKRKPMRPAKGSARTKPSGAVTLGRGKPAEKYEQPGAPWWKQHLPS
jgi:hypothetical protein